MPRQLLLRIAPVWILLVIVGSFLPGPKKEAIGTFTPYSQAAAGDLRWQHRAAHFATFGVTALLLILIARTRSGRVAACCGAIALGCLIEVVQNYVFRVGLEWWDMRDDTLSSAGALAIASFHRVRAILVREG